MRYLLDTNVMIALVGRKPSIVNELRFIPAADVALSEIVRFELLYGALKSGQRVANLAGIEGLAFPLVPFNSDDAFRAAEVRAYLEARGTPIGPYDTLIAGQALARDLTLVTRNTREFERVDGLRLENWEA